MHRRQALWLIAGAMVPLCTGGTALAQSLADSVIGQLRAQGYRDFIVETTWLGRTRIVGIRGRNRREIVVDQRTGEILRDVTSGGGGGKLRDDRGGNRGSGNSGSGNSGSGNNGSGNSGSGSSGSDDDDDDRDDDSDDTDDSGGGRGRGRGGDSDGQGQGRGRGGDDSSGDSNDD